MDPEDSYDDEDSPPIFLGIGNIYIVNLLLSKGITPRSEKYRHQRLDWKTHLAMCEATCGFQRRYHMTFETFNKLVSLLRDDLQIHRTNSRSSTKGVSPIDTEIIVAAGLRYLGGETTKSVADIFGMSLDSSRRVIRKFCSAVNNNNSLRINLPKTQDELNRIAAEFSSISSTEGLYSGCIGALDGWL